MRVERQEAVQQDPNAHLLRVGAGILAFATIAALAAASLGGTFAHRWSGRVAPQEIATVASADKPAKAPAAQPKAKLSAEDAKVAAGAPEIAGAKTIPHAAEPEKSAAGEARVAENNTAASAASKVAGGAFAVELGVAGSKAEARHIMRKVASKYGAQFGGRRVGYRHVKDGHKSVYRVEVGGMSKKAAGGICKKVKWAGGNCFVTVN